MPRPAKGSEEAKAWGAKMKSAREAKKLNSTTSKVNPEKYYGKKFLKNVKGGMMGEESDDELAELTANMTMKDDNKPSSRPSAVPKEFKKPTIVRRRTPPLPVFETKPVGKRQAETQITKGKGIKGKGAGASTAMSVEQRRMQTLQESLALLESRIQESLQDYYDNPTSVLAISNLNHYLNSRNRILTDINNLNGTPELNVPTVLYRYPEETAYEDLPEAEISIPEPTGRGMKGGSLFVDGNPIFYEAIAIALGLLVGIPAYVKLSNMIRDYVRTGRQILPETLAQMLEEIQTEQEGTETMTEMSENRSDVSDLEQGEVRDAESTTGGKIKIGKAFKKIGKSFDKAGRNLNVAFGKAGTAVNPMTYALGNKKISNLMRQSGQLTNNYLLPAAVSAGLPLYYGAAGTAGMMVGGPLGALAATKAADTLWQEAVVKKGYDPRERQKSKVLGAISEKVGQAGAAQFKAGTSSGKEKKMSGKGNNVFSVDDPFMKKRMEMAKKAYEQLNIQKANMEKRMSMAGKGYYLSPGMTVAQPTNKRNLKKI